MAQSGAAAGEEADQVSITWTDPNYPYPLNGRGVALHYFERSPFFDPSSNNNTARQQGRDPAVLGALEFVVPAGGLEFVVESEQPPHLFVIRKQQRRGVDTSLPGAVTLLAMYYILDKVIYQAPRLHAVLSSRIRRCVWSLHYGFARLRSDLDPLTKLNQYQARQQQQQQQQELHEELGGAPVRVQHVNSALTAAALQQAQEALGQQSQDEVKPIPMIRRVPPEVATQWKRTDNIIMTVLSGYPVPTLPDVYYQAHPVALPTEAGLAPMQRP